MATSASNTTRRRESLRSCWARVSALRHLGVSSVHRRGCIEIRGVTRSGVEDGIELMLAHTAGELEKEVFQAQVLGGGLLLELGHVPGCDDPATVDDGD